MRHCAGASYGASGRQFQCGVFKTGERKHSHLFVAYWLKGQPLVNINEEETSFFTNELSLLKRMLRKQRRKDKRWKEEEKNGKESRKRKRKQVNKHKMMQMLLGSKRNVIISGKG